MKPCRPFRRASALTLIFVLACTVSLPIQAAAMTESATPAALTEAANSQFADYRQAQFLRLAEETDRDSLIAAQLLGMPYEFGVSDDSSHQPQPIFGLEEVEQRLAQIYADDPLVAFTLALSCQMRSAACVDSARYDALVAMVPDNTVNWLLLPNNTAPSDQQLHSAATAQYADTHLPELLGIVRTALAGQPPAWVPSNVDSDDLALLLRRSAADQVALPFFGALVRLCKKPTSAQRDDCIEVSRRLEDERSGTILPRMIGSAMLRRLVKGTPDEVEAMDLRRDYVWMSEQLEASTLPYREQLQADTVTLGEWAACQRRVKQLTGRDTAPTDWVPRNPQSLLLSEERTQAPPAK